MTVEKQTTVYPSMGVCLPDLFCFIILFWHWHFWLLLQLVWLCLAFAAFAASLGFVASAALAACWAFLGSVAFVTF